MEKTLLIQQQAELYKYPCIYKDLHRRHHHHHLEDLHQDHLHLDRHLDRGRLDRGRLDRGRLDRGRLDRGRLDQQGDRDYLDLREEEDHRREDQDRPEDQDRREDHYLSMARFRVQNQYLLHALVVHRQTHDAFPCDPHIDLLLSNMGMYKYRHQQPL